MLDEHRRFGVTGSECQPHRGAGRLTRIRGGKNKTKSPGLIRPCGLEPSTAADKPSSGCPCRLPDAIALASLSRSCLILRSKGSVYKQALLGPSDRALSSRVLSPHRDPTQKQLLSRIICWYDADLSVSLSLGSRFPFPTHFFFFFEIHSVRAHTLLLLFSACVSKSDISKTCDLFLISDLFKLKAAVR